VMIFIKTWFPHLLMEYYQYIQNYR
jgi:hypothetical protein